MIFLFHHLFIQAGMPTKAAAKAPAAAKGTDSSRGKGGFFLAKWFGFGFK